MSNLLDAKLIDTVPVANILGEGVLWDEINQSVWWLDIEGCQIFQYHLATKQLETYSTPERVGCFGFIENSDKLIVAFESGIGYFSPESGEIDWLAKPEQAQGSRFNDGRLDRLGRFWPGTMMEAEQDAEPLAKLYQVNANGEVIERLDGIRVCNGLCWSPDGLVMYHADSPTRTIWRYDSNPETGELSNKQVFVQTPENIFPDGSTVDKHGNMWNAQWDGARVTCYSPNGQQLGKIDVPAGRSSCVAFGGENLDLMFVTSAKIGLTEQQLQEQPHAGHLFIYQLDQSIGLVEPRFKPE
ncbi:gluconolaconase [Saccharobesus litoralis]|uniref:Gluconolaconase n=1 Tax=Saccharobesus litoralis TaxID=2172099 RepID=A0A2S0VVB1_9ALTE|nr:SMP-30/gluconolactonase/LRE family protein [Saccharobesus litoralis]AWB68164.1 gluconolaconase [Saccharobesus litoralis]